jgi:hypothetical protein
VAIVLPALFLWVRIMDPKAAEAIKERHERKEALMADMRRARVEQYREQYSYLGVAVISGMLTASPGIRLDVYKRTAKMANDLFAAGFEESGRIYASLCRGLLRGTKENFGAEAANELADVVLNEPGIEIAPPAPLPEPPPEQTQAQQSFGDGLTYVPPSGNDTSLSGVATPVPPEVSAAAGFAPEDELDLTTGPAREAGAGLITDMPADSEPPYGVDLTAPDLDITLGVLERVGEDDDYEPDVVDSTKPAVSPEPDPDRAERARQRRAARKAAKTSGTLQ